MNLHAFGNVAEQWALSHCDGDEMLSVADIGSISRAAGDVITSRSTGAFRGAMVLFSDPRRELLASIYPNLVGGKSDDVFLAHMNAFAAGNVSIDGRTQAAVETGPFLGQVRKYFRDLWAVADVIAFRSAYELEMAARSLGTRPTRVTFYAPLDRTVPIPPSLHAETQDTIAIWAVNVHPHLVECTLRSLFDVRLKTVVISDPQSAGEHLATSRVIVSLSDDPGTACALASYGKPLCAASHGAAEMLSNVHTFDIWNPQQLVDAVLRALADGPAVFLEHMRTRLLPPVPPAKPPLNSTPLVSIVITVYNRLESLLATLKELQKQTYPNIEIVVVSNNGPRADDVCAEFPNVTYIHREHNSGATAAPRNDGIKASNGTYITCLDDDDVYFPDHIERMVRICENGSKVVYGDFILQIVERLHDGTERVLGYDLERGDAITAFELLVTNRIGYMTVFAHRDVYDQLGTYDDVRMKGSEEVELWLRMARRYSLAHADCATSCYTVRKNWQGSLTETERSRYADGYERMYAHYSVEQYPLIAEQRRQHIARLRSTAADPPREPHYPAPSTVFQ
jgi:glycosyltransferase involved in cell wall biosynthesis